VKESKYQFRFFQLYLLLSGWLILTYPVFSFAQARSSADSISVLTLKDSSIYLGEVRLKRDSNFVFQVNQRGPMIVDYRDVILLEKKQFHGLSAFTQNILDLWTVIKKLCRL